MATVTLSDAAANAVLTDINGLLNAGSGAAICEVYNGTKPAKPDVAITTQTKLGTLTCSDPAGTVASRSLTFSAITQDSSADASGVAAWARFKDSSGTAVVDVDISITGGSGFFQMNTTSIVATGPILCTSCAITV